MTETLPAKRKDDVVLTLAQPDHLPSNAVESESKQSDLAHINNSFDIAYAAIKVARKTSEFCSIIKAIQTSIEMRRKILGHDSGRKGSKGRRSEVELLG